MICAVSWDFFRIKHISALRFKPSCSAKLARAGRLHCSPVDLKAQCLADGMCSLTLGDEMPSALFLRVLRHCCHLGSCLPGWIPG